MISSPGKSTEWCKYVGRLMTNRIDFLADPGLSPFAACLPFQVNICVVGLSGFLRYKMISVRIPERGEDPVERRRLLNILAQRRYRECTGQVVESV